MVGRSSLVELDSARSLRRTDYNTNPAGLVELVDLVTPRRGASRSNDAAAGLDVMPGDPPALLAHQKRDDIGDVLRLSQPT